MAVRTISTKLAVEGEAEYKQKIASCNSELKTLKSSLALVQSEYKNNANSMEALTAKGEALSAMQTAQAKKVAELEKALENCQKAQTAYADRVAAAEANVSKYEQALAELKDSTGDTSEEQAALTAELEKWKEELANAEAGQNAAERGVFKLTAWTWIQAVIWVPLVRATGDIAKMAGYPIGWVWRIRNRPPEWRGD